MLRSSSSSAGRFSARRILTTSLQSSSTTTAVTPRFATQAIAAKPSVRFSQNRFMSSFAEPGSMFVTDPRPSGDDKTIADTLDKDAPLRADIRAMGALLGQIVKDHHGKAIFEKIEELRGLSKQWRMAGAGRDANQAEDADVTFAELTKVCANLTNEEILVIARAFNFFLSIANAAEGHHRIRRLNMATKEEALPDRYDSW